MDFTVKDKGLEFKISLKDTKLIEEYSKNPQEFEKVIGIYMASLQGYFHSSEEIRQLLNQMDVENLEKKISLLNSYEKKDSN